MWSPLGVQPLPHQKKDSMWSPHGVQWSLCGVHRNSMGEGKVHGLYRLYYGLDSTKKKPGNNKLSLYSALQCRTKFIVLCSAIVRLYSAI